MELSRWPRRSSRSLTWRGRPSSAATTTTSTTTKPPRERFPTTNWRLGAAEELTLAESQASRENLSESPSLLTDCPPDLYAKLVVAVDSADFLARIKALQQQSVDGKHFPFKVATVVAKAMGGVSKFQKVLGIWHAGQLFYALSTWGLALAVLYKTRAVIKVAAMGVHTTSKMIMRAIHFQKKKRL